jgi:hypothetical protein
VSVAARQLSGSRWGSQKPVLLARELELRVSELPEAERVRLLHALAMTQTEGEPCSAPDPTPSRPTT